MILGVAYYPEHWPRERWETDAKLMRDAGVRRVRLAEFAWHRLEPREGQFEFDWLREATELLARYEIQIILCTPTPTYPAWLHRLIPDIHQVRSDGLVKEFGMRQDACKNHPGYRYYAFRVTEKLAAALGEHPAVVAWQTDNEFGCHQTARCHCNYCERAFQEWLRKRFEGDIGKLNVAWGTAFWSQEYNDFGEVCIPRDTPSCAANDGQNPGLLLDFYRFSSDVQVNFQKELIAIIRRHSPGRPITHNFMGTFSHINYYDLARELDIVSWDNYPFAVIGTNRPPAAMAHDLMRGLKRKNVWVMEQGSGPGGWGAFRATPQPGQMRLWAYQAVARGADMISFFRWRSCRWGREQYWHGILYHHGMPQRRYEEIKQIGAEFGRLAPELKDTAVESPVAILYDYESLWALEIQPNARDGFDYKSMADRACETFTRLGLTCDFVEPGVDISRYAIVVAPCQHICTPELARQLSHYVAQGGLLVLGPRSGVKDTENAVVDELLPGPLREMAGCYVEEYDAFSTIPGFEMFVADSDGNRYRAHGLAEVLVPIPKAEVLLTYAARYYAGRAAAVRHRIGKGACIYIGTLLEDLGLRALLASLLREARVPFIENLPPCIEITHRSRKGQRYTFYLNHSDSEQTLRIECQGQELITGANVAEKLTLPAFGVGIVKERKS